jgi:hypothetical protein
MRKLEIVTAALAAVALASPAWAQGRGHDRDDARIPPGQMPSAGMCRIWINGVPPGRQPRQTDCATARANLPPNATIIYGGGQERHVYTSNGTVIPGRVPVGTGLPSRIPGSTQYPYPNAGQYPYGYPSQVVNPVVRMNGQQCVQYTDATGRARYDCNRADVNRQLVCNANPGSSACSSNAYIHKHKKHKGGDQDEDRDHRGNRGDR